MLKIKKNIVFFSSGGIGYGVIELLWRGRTHWTMIIAGGICFVIFSRIAERCRQRRLAYKAVLCSAGVTLVELIFGVICNIILKMNVWDYSNVPFNFMGQICLSFSAVWCLFGFAFVPLADMINKKFEMRTS